MSQFNTLRDNNNYQTINWLVGLQIEKQTGKLMEVQAKNRQEIKAQRAEIKAQRRQKKRLQHQDIFQINKYQTYYDELRDEEDKNEYYKNVDLQKISYEELHQLVSSTFKHAKRRENFFTIVDRHPDHQLKCVYSGDILSDQEGNFLQKCDEEHSFPQSYQRGSKSGTGRDMHAIFSAGKSANGSRGNTPFGNFGKLVESYRYGSLYKDGNLKTYEPTLNSGAVARASLYILVCYKNCANPQYLPKRCLQWMVKNAFGGEVTQWQKHRNQVLYNLQGNRNPFIDFPQLAKRIDFSEGWQK